ncbi:hypothetical protein WHX55_24210 [Pseudomonas fluorescens]|uniref:hypothetical protein n=1 Tax=Pseudomonas fluorescens TaxID=294 RepID=UPI003256175E
MSNYKEKLNNLRNRRLGETSSYTFDSASASTGLEHLIYNSRSEKENYETRASGEATKYALGSMQEVGTRYTEISYEEGKRVISQISNGLSALPLRASFEFQGSVPLNVHIRGVSDVDILVLHEEFVTLDWNGPAAGTYTRLPNPPTVLEQIQYLRSQCENLLINRYPAATVDISGDKSISLSGGSLKRKIDIVPSHWHHSATYQQSQQKHDKEVKILHKSKNELLSNSPFLHMRKINDKDLQTNGGVKKVIRLIKNIKNDSNLDIKLSSYDIASLVWHFDNSILTKPSYMELSLISETQQKIESMILFESHTRTLATPDNSRKIIDSEEKWNSLILLNDELIALSEQIAREIQPHLYHNSLPTIRRALSESYIY